MAKAKRTKATDISPSVRKMVWERDKGCIFCTHYDFKPTGQAVEIMHYIPRSSGGLGIPENLGLGCIYHHRLMDEGKYEHKQMMKALFRDYLRTLYGRETWKEEKLVWSYDMNFREEDPNGE